MFKAKAGLSIGRKLLIGVLATVMMASSAISFAYWRDMIEGSNSNKDLSVVIGAGRAEVTQVHLSGGTGSSNNLIPYTRTPDSNNNETTSITFTVNVVWVIEGQDTNITDTGSLYVELLSIKANDDATTNYKDVNGLGGDPLFRITINHSGSVEGVHVDNEENAIPTPVTIRVEMNEPATREQYEQIAGRSMSLVLKFTVDSSYEAGTTPPVP